MTICKQEVSTVPAEGVAGSIGEILKNVSAQMMDEVAKAAQTSSGEADTGQQCGTDEPSIVDFFGTGSVMGEMGVLEKMPCNATVECETDVQVRRLNHQAGSCQLRVHLCTLCVYLCPF